MAEIFTMVKDKISPAIATNRFAGNVILCGGGSLMQGATELASEIFDTPAVRLGIPGTFGGLTGEYRSPEFAAVLGLILSQYKQRAASGEETKKMEAEQGKIIGKLKDFWKNLF